MVVVVSGVVKQEKRVCGPSERCGRHSARLTCGCDALSRLRSSAALACTVTWGFPLCLRRNIASVVELLFVFLRSR